MSKLGSHRIIKVSAAAAKLKFIECGPSCISKKDCTSKCCDMVSHPQGMKVTVHSSEERRIKKLGVNVIDGMLQPTQGKKVCPFKGGDHLCILHDTGEKPFGCVVSPFMLNRSDTLVIRNRYKLLPCYDTESGDYAYRVFYSSLQMIFGAVIASDIKCKFDLQTVNEDLHYTIPIKTYQMMSDREKLIRASKTNR